MRGVMCGLKRGLRCRVKQYLIIVKVTMMKNHAVFRCLN